MAGPRSVRNKHSASRLFPSSCFKSHILRDLVQNTNWIWYAGGAEEEDQDLSHTHSVAALNLHGVLLKSLRITSAHSRCQSHVSWTSDFNHLNMHTRNAHFWCKLERKWQDLGFGTTRWDVGSGLQRLNFQFLRWWLLWHSESTCGGVPSAESLLMKTWKGKDTTKLTLFLKKSLAAQVLKLRLDSSTSQWPRPQSIHPAKSDPAHWIPLDPVYLIPWFSREIIHFKPKIATREKIKLKEPDLWFASLIPHRNRDCASNCCVFTEKKKLCQTLCEWKNKMFVLVIFCFIFLFYPRKREVFKMFRYCWSASKKIPPAAFVTGMKRFLSSHDGPLQQ